MHMASIYKCIGMQGYIFDFFLEFITHQKMQFIINPALIFPL